MLTGKLASSSDRTKRAVILEADGIDRKSAVAKLRWSSYASGFETNRSIPNRWDRNLATSFPLTLCPALSSGGANVPSPPLPGETVTIPPLIPLFPGRPMS